MLRRFLVFGFLLFALPLCAASSQEPSAKFVNRVQEYAVQHNREAWVSSFSEYAMITNFAEDLTPAAFYDEWLAQGTLEFDPKFTVTCGAYHWRFLELERARKKYPIYIQYLVNSDAKEPKIRSIAVYKDKPRAVSFSRFYAAFRFSRSMAALRQTFARQYEFTDAERIEIVKKYTPSCVDEEGLYHLFPKEQLFQTSFLNPVVNGTVAICTWGFVSGPLRFNRGIAQLNLAPNGDIANVLFYCGSESFDD